VRGRDVYRSCTTKKRYRTDLEAQRAASTYRRHRDRRAVTLRAYECGVCGGYHLTSKREYER
jgi:hypothetical protein